MSTLARVFDPRANSLNAVRLLLATGVIAWHSFPLSGSASPPRQVAELMGNGFVDGFFAISGYLILSSWMRTPRWWPFLRARALRILPGFYVCLLATALIFAPLSVLLDSGSEHLQPSSAVSFVTRNALLRINQYGIAGTLTHVPDPVDGWNGSLWTLWWEFLCYLGVLFLGLTRLLRFRLVLPVVFLLSLVALIAVTYAPTGNYYLNHAPRFLVMFVAGALVYTAREWLPASWPLVGLAGVLVIACLWIPEPTHPGKDPTPYLIVAALPLAYLLITAGALVRAPRLRLRNDISYGMYVYAFPVQQLLATVGVHRLGIAPYFVIATLVTVPFAAASWFWVERPMLRLKGRPQPRTGTAEIGTPVALPTRPGPAHRR